MQSLRLFYKRCYAFSLNVNRWISVRLVRTGWLLLHCQERSAGFLLFRPTQKYRLSLQEKHQRNRFYLLNILWHHYSVNNYSWRAHLMVSLIMTCRALNSSVLEKLGRLAPRAWQNLSASSQERSLLSRSLWNTWGFKHAPMRNRAEPQESTEAQMYRTKGLWTPQWAPNGLMSK